MILGACSSASDNPGKSTDDNFDRGALLKNVADNIIVPSFKAFDVQLTALKQKADNFIATPETGTLEEVRTAWLEAYKGWQTVAMFNIGKAEEIEFNFFFNTFPLTEADVTNNINNGTYDLNHVNNHDAQGFPALDYLFFGVGNTDADIIANYTTNSKAANYKKYVLDIVTKMKEINTQIIANWEGGFRNSFVASTGNTATSSLNKLVNDYIFYYERRLRAEKVGIPVGVFSQGTLYPEKVEAVYKKTASKELLLKALTTVKNVFNGKELLSGTNGVGFDDYLKELGREDLATKINNQILAAENQINMLSANLFEQINAGKTDITEKSKVTMAYDELQKVVALFKVEMLKVIDVNVDYVDADGD